MDERTNKQKMEDGIKKIIFMNNGKCNFEFEYNEDSDTVYVTKMEKDKFGKIMIPPFVSYVYDSAWNNKCCECELYIPEGCKLNSGDSYYEYKVSMYTKSIDVAKQHEEYAVEDGVLFNKDKTVLLAYPSYKEDKTYTIPESVYEVKYGALWFSDFLEEIKISKNLHIIGSQFFNMNIKFTVDESNEMFKSVEGSLYSKDGKILYHLHGEQFEDLKVEEGTLIMKAQQGNGEYGKVYLPSSLESMEMADMLFNTYAVSYEEIIAPVSMKNKLEEFEKVFKIIYY